MDRGLEAAVRTLARGGLVVYPTDTLYGLGARATDRRAIERLYALKGRPRDRPIAIAVASLEEIEPLVEADPVQRAFVRRTLPGATTVVLPASRWARSHLAPLLIAEGGRIGLRVPDHPLARELARRAGPLSCTSANRHGRPDAATLEEARRQLGGEGIRYLSGGPTPAGRGSRIVDLTGPLPTVLRA